MADPKARSIEFVAAPLLKEDNEDKEPGTEELDVPVGTDGPEPEGLVPEGLTEPLFVVDEFPRSRETGKPKRLHLLE